MEKTNQGQGEIEVFFADEIHIDTRRHSNLPRQNSLNENHRVSQEAWHGNKADRVQRRSFHRGEYLSNEKPSTRRSVTGRRLTEARRQLID